MSDKTYTMFDLVKSWEGGGGGKRNLNYAIKKPILNIKTS